MNDVPTVTAKGILHLSYIPSHHHDRAEVSHCNLDKMTSGKDVGRPPY